MLKSKMVKCIRSKMGFDSGIGRATFSGSYFLLISHGNGRCVSGIINPMMPRFSRVRPPSIICRRRGIYVAREIGGATASGDSVKAPSAPGASNGAEDFIESGDEM